MFIARANNISTTAHRVRLCAAVFAASVAYFSIPATAAAPTSEETCSANMDAVTSVSPSPFHSLLTYHMKRNPESGYVTMATVENAKPRARTVLFQGLAEEDDGSIGICIKTHAASNKIVQADSSSVEIVWWMERTAVQFRFSGNINYKDETQRKRVWSSLHVGAKSQFFYSPPGENKLDTSTSGPYFQEEKNKAREVGLNGPPPDSFAVGVLYPDQVDFLDLSTLKRSNWKRVVVEEEECAAQPPHKWIEKSGYAPPVVSTAE